MRETNGKTGDTKINTRVFSFIGGDNGPWRVVSLTSIIGEALTDVKRLNIIPESGTMVSEGGTWQLRGITSNERYVTRAEHDLLVTKQPVLGRPHATCAALIPIRKTAAWWALAQDDRRHIFEESTRHVATGLKYLPAIARRLHHCRDLGENEPFDFLTWFEFEPSNAATFEELVAKLRASEEWTYVEREIDIRLERDPV